MHPQCIELCIEFDINLNNWPGFISGFLKSIDIPRFMKGLVKSMTCSLEKKVRDGDLFCRKLAQFCRNAIYFIVRWELYWKFSQCIKHRWWISSYLHTAWKSKWWWSDLHTEPGVVDGHWSHSNVRLPVNQLPHDPVPLLGLMVVDPVHLVWHRVYPGLSLTMLQWFVSFSHQTV